MSDLLMLEDVERRVCLKRAKLYAMIADGEFPPPIKVSAGRSAWLSDDIAAWIIAKAAESRKPVGGDHDQ